MSVITYKGYQGHYEYDSDFGIFHGDILHIKDVVTFQGLGLHALLQAKRV
jgi:predicted HicB family RNase H-like nuclease